MWHLAHSNISKCCIYILVYVVFILRNYARSVSTMSSFVLDVGFVCWINRFYCEFICRSLILCVALHPFTHSYIHSFICEWHQTSDVIMKLFTMLSRMFGKWYICMLRFRAWTMKGLLLICLTATLLAQTWCRQRQVKVSRLLGLTLQYFYGEGWSSS